MKYLRTLLLSLQSQFIARANIIGWIMVGAIPPLVLTIVWLSILGDRPSINGFAKGDFIIYYLFMTFFWYIVGGSFVFQLGSGIKNGQINTTLLKPYNVVLESFFKEQAYKIISLFVAIPPTLTILYIYQADIHFHLTGMDIIFLILSLLFGAINFALLESIVGLTAFWITEIWPVVQMNTSMGMLFGGIMLPLTLMPGPLLLVANILPYKYIFYLPVSILLSKSQNIWLDLSIQLGYMVILYAIFQFIWRRGIVKYEAVGS